MKLTALFALAFVTLAPLAASAQIRLAETYEPKGGNDTLLTATVVQIPSILPGHIGRADLDYYLLALPMECAVEVTLTFEQRPNYKGIENPNIGDLTLGLFDAKGAPLDESATTENVERIVIPAGRGGIVYIGVYGADDTQTTNLYRVTFVAICGAPQAPEKNVTEVQEASEAPVAAPDAPDALTPD